MAKKKTTTHKDENKRDKFIRVFTPKVNKAVHFIGLVGNGAGAAYAPTAEDIAELIAAMRTAVDAVETRFSSGASTPSGFKFGG